MRVKHLRGYVNADQLDTESSASRQHWIDTGHYLRKGEALDWIGEQVASGERCEACGALDPCDCTVYLVDNS